MNNTYGYDTNNYEVTSGNLKNISLTKKTYEELQEEIVNLTADNFFKKQKIDRLNNIIKIMENYLELIYDLGYDYDGLTEAGDLQGLINELCRYASLGRAYNTTEIIYENNGKKYNILYEELKGEDKELKENNSANITN